MKKKILNLFILIISFFMFLPDVNAASLSISASSNNVVNGNTVTITVKASGVAGKFSITSSNGNVLSGGTSSVWLENESKTYKFTAKSIGSATITVKTLDAADSSGNAYSSSKSVKINVVKPREKSTNNNLKSLSVDGYTLSPSFNKNTLEYTVDLESSVEKINISASKEDGYASLYGTGEKEVQEGDNKFEIIVTSETGKSKTYTINAVVKDSNPITKKIDGESYTVVKRASALTKPEQFTETKVVISDIEIPAFVNEKTNLTLIGLKDEKGSIYLYKYDAKTDSYEKYETLTSISKTIIFENNDEEKDGFTKTNVKINDQDYVAYQNDKNKDYILVYGTCLETGDKNWYLYNIKEQSVQTYMSDIIDDMQNDFDKVVEEYKIVILVMAGLSLLLLIILVSVIISKSKMKKKLMKKIMKSEVKELPKVEEKKQEEVVKKDKKDSSKPKEKVVNKDKKESKK